MRPFRSRVGHPLFDHLVLAITILIGLGASWSLYRSIENQAQAKRQDRISAIGQSVIDSFDLQLARTMESLRVFTVMAGAQGTLSQSVFERLGASMLNDRSVVSMLEWQPVVPAARRKAFELEAAALTGNHFQLTEPQGDRLVPARERSEHVPVLYTWPHRAGAVGVDMAFDPARMRSKYKARDAGVPIASETFTIIRSEAAQSEATQGFAISAPVYSGEAPVGRAQRQEQLLGYVAAVIEVRNLFRDAALRASSAGLDILVFDQADHQRQLIFSDANAPMNLYGESPLTSNTSLAMTVDVGSRPWEIVLHARPDFLAADASRFGLLTLVGGALATLLVATSMHWAQVSRRRLVASQGELMAAMRFNETILANSPLAMGVYRATGQCVQVNDAYASLMGTVRDALLAQNFHEMVAWRECGLLTDCKETLAGQHPMRREIQVETPSGQPIWTDCLLVPLQLQGTSHLLITFVDLSTRKALEEKLRGLAFKDPLTNLPNRRVLMDRMGLAIASSKRRNSHGAVLFLDLNKFKHLNDTHGHEAGDQLLIVVADRLRATVRETDTVARLGGDEFVVLVEDLGSDESRAIESASKMADKIRDSLMHEYVLGEVRHSGSASIGISLFLGDAVDAEQILKDADAAMYEAKRASKKIEAR